jgi:hypothetical protein
VFPDRDVLVNKNRMAERKILAETFRLKDEQMMDVSRLYGDLAEKNNREKADSLREPSAGDNRGTQSLGTY